MAIITTNEVIQYSLAERGYSPDKIARVKDVVESRFFRNVLGLDFYDILKADAKNWENKPQWTAGTYANGDIVWWQDNLFQSTQNSNTEEPSLVATKWKEADRFNTSEYNNLWKLYIRPIVANEVLKITVPIDTTRFTAKGAMVYVEDKSNAIGADQKSLDYSLRTVQQFIDMATAEMVEYINLQYQKYQSNPATGFDYGTAKVQFLNQYSAEVQNKQGRRLAWPE